jgi:hypothetical protein
MNTVKLPILGPCSMTDATPLPRGRGRPATPPETHRRSVNVRLPPSLLQRLETAAAAGERSLSREIELRCNAHETLMALVGTETVSEWTQAPEAILAVIEALAAGWHRRQSENERPEGQSR